MKMKQNLISRRKLIDTGVKTGVAVFLGPAVFPDLLAAPVRRRSVPEFDVLKFGARGDGKTLDTHAIQAAIDRAARAGNGARVIVRGGRRYLVGSLQLKSGIDFHLADDAELVLSTARQHYGSNGVITAYEAQGLRISGTGNIRGRALEFMDHYDEENEIWIAKEWRPKMFVLTTCRDLEICDISFSEAPEWGLHMIGCEHVLVDNLRVLNNLDVPNCDGIDPDHCRDVEIRNCHIVCGDDAIVVKATHQEKDYGPSNNIVVRDCVMETQDSGLKIGTETTQDIHHILFERCKIISSCRGLNIQLRDEGSVHDIVFRDITFTSRYHSAPWWGRGEAISLTAIPRTPQTKTGTIHDIAFYNITGKSENSVRINGSVESRICNVVMEDINLTIDRWTQYPGGVFDNRPTLVYQPIEPHNTAGFSIRHADRVSLKNCSLEWGSNRPEYFTHAIEAEHVTGLSLTNFKGVSANPGTVEDVILY